MKVLLCCFSGTGNTLKVANTYRRAFPQGADIMLLPHDPPVLDAYGIVGFGYPIHAFNAPEVFVRFLKSLPQGNGKACFLFKTSGEGLSLNDASSSRSLSILRKKGYHVMGERHYLMPYNLVFRTSPAVVGQMERTMEGMVPLHVASLLDGKDEAPRYSLGKRLFSSCFLIEWWYAHNQHFHVDENACSLCGMCVRHCPAKAIVLENGKIRFSKGCMLCMRCAFFCPKDAIRLGILDNWRVNGAYRSGSGGELDHAWLYRGYFAKCEKELREK